MATHHGKDGTVKIGANAVAEIENWSVTAQADVAEDTAMGDDWKTHIVGKTINSWNGNLACHHDASDTTGQVALAIGASVTLNLYPEGSAAAAKYKTGLVTITNITSNVTLNGVVSKAFTFQGNGPLTDAVVGS